MIENQDNDLGFIKLTLNNFIEIYEKKKKEEYNENLNKKATELINNYNCFISNYDAKSLWEKKKMIAQKKNSKSYNISNKPKVLLIDLSDEMKCKKEFTSYLNKLTDLNKETIYNKISLFIKELNSSIQNSLFEVLINFIKVSSNNIYIDVLFLFDIDYINKNIIKYYNNFINNKEWLPNEIIIDCKILYKNDNYDKYCSYVKLKKHSISIIKALMIIFRKLNYIDYIEYILKEIYIDLNKYINEGIYKHIVELLLDQIIIIIDFLPNKDIINNIKDINLTNFEYSTKFKIMKIIDSY